MSPNFPGLNDKNDHKFFLENMFGFCFPNKQFNQITFTAHSLQNVPKFSSLNLDPKIRTEIVLKKIYLCTYINQDQHKRNQNVQQLLKNLLMEYNLPQTKILKNLNKKTTSKKYHTKKFRI